MLHSDLLWLLHYEPTTGVFTWAVKPAKQIAVGTLAGYVGRSGYVFIRIQGELHYAHRLVFFYVTGAWPGEQIDHVNGVKADNRWANLREVTQTENLRNCAKSKSNKSGITGVHWDKKKSKWVARIMANRKTVFLGHFDNVLDAARARKAADTVYGFHLNHGRLLQ